MRLDDDSYVNLPELWKLFMSGRYSRFQGMDQLFVGRMFWGAPMRPSENDLKMKFILPSVCPYYMFTGDKFPDWFGGGGKKCTVPSHNVDFAS